MIKHKNTDAIASQYLFPNLLEIAKSLVMNSIDAKASRIVLVVDVGQFEIKVYDNGIIPFPSLDLIGEAQLQILPSSYTSNSKLYGFRGRSLLAIANVSASLTIVTRLNFEYVIKSVKDGISSIQSTPRLSESMTTLVQVNEIFKMLPMRRSIINLTQEVSEIKKMVEIMSLAHSCTTEFQLDFASVVLPRMILTKTNDLMESYLQVFPVKCLNDAVCVQIKRNDFSIDGFYLVSAHGQSSKKILLVNHWHLISGPVFKHLENIFKAKLQTKYVDFLIHISIPANMVDKNVADQKEPIILKDVAGLKSLISAYISEKVVKQAPSIVSDSVAASTSTSKSKYWDTDGVIKVSPSHLQQHRRISWKNPVYKPSEDKKISSCFPRSMEDVQISRSDLARFTVIAQVDKKFIACRMNNLLLILDQHAVDERINLEANLKDYLAGYLPTKEQTVLPGITLPISYLSPVKRYNDKLCQYGFKITKLEPIVTGSFNFTVSITRKFCGQLNPTRLIVECIDYLSSAASCSSISIPSPILEYFKSKACRGAVMFGDELSISQCSDLIKKLRICKNPFQCAHGRPSLVPISYL